MAEPIRPAATSTFGRENWIFVTAVANQAAPTAAEVNAATGLDITRILMASTGQPTQNTNRVTAERRLGDTTQYEFIGTTTYTGGDLSYAFNPQGAPASDGKKLWEKIPAGTTGFLIRRMGVARATTPAAGQFVDVYPVEFGPSLPGSSGDGESSEAVAVASFAVTGPPSLNVAIAA